MDLITQAFINRRKKEEEERRKAEANFLERTFQTTTDLVGNVISGATRQLEGIYDAGASLVGLVGGWFDEDFQNSVAEHIKYDATGTMMANSFDQWTQDSYLNEGEIGQMVEGMAQGLGQMLPSVALSFVPGGAALSRVSLLAGATGNGIQDALNDGATYEQAMGYGAIQGAVEYGTEKLFAGNKLVGKGVFGNSDIAKQGAKRVLKNAVGEGIEEVVSEVANPLAKSIYKGKDAFKEYADLDYWKGVAEAGVIGAGTSLAYQGTVEPMLAKTGHGAVGKEADIVESLEAIQNIRRRTANMQSREALSLEQNRQAEQVEYQNFKQIENTLSKMSSEKRQEVIKKYKLDDFDSNGVYNGSLAPTSQENDIYEEFATPQKSRITEANKQAVSRNLWSNARKIDTELSELQSDAIRTVTKALTSQNVSLNEAHTEAQRRVGELKVYSGEMDADTKSQLNQVSKAMKAINNNAKTNNSYVLLDSTEAFGGAVKGNTMYLTIDELKSGKWKKTLIHELTHFQEGSNEYVKLSQYMDDLYNKNGSIYENARETIIKKRYVTQNEYNHILELVSKGEKLNEEDRSTYELIRSEITAHEAEMVLGNQDFINRIINEDENLAKKLFQRIVNLKKALNDKALLKAENLWLDSAKEMGNAKLYRELAKMADREEVKEVEISGNSNNSTIRDYLPKAFATAVNSEGRFAIGKESFGKMIDSWDRKTIGFSFVLGETPSFISSLEIGNTEIGKRQVRVDASKLQRVMSEHTEMTKEVIKQLPDLLNNPILVIKSKSHNSRIVLLGEVYANNKVVNMVLELNPTTRSGKSTYLNIAKIASAYIRTNLENYINTSEILYLDKNKNRVDNWLKVNRLQLPLLNSQYDSVNMNSISNNSQNVNQNTQNNQINSEKSSYSLNDSERFNSKKSDIRYSLDTFDKQVDDLLNGADTNSTHLLVRKDTPQIFIDLGLENKPMLITAAHSKTAIGEQVSGMNMHTVSTKVFKNLPKLLENPIIVMESTKENSIVAVINAVDNEGSPIICPINFEGRGYYNNIEIETNHIASVYGKSTNPIGFISKAVEENRILYWDEKKSQELFKIPGLQLPDNLKTLGSNTIIRKVNKKVKSLSKDSLGNLLNQQQSEFFKDSKVRDENGNLQVVYHGTPNEFYTFDRNRLGNGSDMYGYGYYFSNSASVGEKYSRKKGKIIQAYLNILNPIKIDTDINGQYDKWEQGINSIVINKDQTFDILMEHPFARDNSQSPFKDFIEVTDLGKLNDEELKYQIKEWFREDSTINDIEWYFRDCRADLLKAINKVLGYDGIVVNFKDSNMKYYVAWFENQIKLISNKAPTKNNDIRYSINFGIDSKGGLGYNKKAKYIPYSTIGSNNVDCVRKQLIDIYKGINDGFANGLAIENGYTVYIIDSGMDNGVLSFGFRWKEVVRDNNLRKGIIRRLIYDSISNGNFCDELSRKYRDKYGFDTASHFGLKPQKELQVNQGQSQHNQGGILEEDEHRGVHSHIGHNVGGRNDGIIETNGTRRLETVRDKAKLSLTDQSEGQLQKMVADLSGERVHSKGETRTVLDGLFKVLFTSNNVQLDIEKSAMNYWTEKLWIALNKTQETERKKNYAEISNEMVSQYFNDFEETDKKSIQETLVKNFENFYEVTGQDSKLSRNKLYQDVQSWREQYFRMVKGNEVLSKVKKFKDIREYLNGSAFDNELFKGSIEELGKVTYRGNLSGTKLKKALSNLNEWYVPDNKIIERDFDKDIKQMLESLSRVEGDFSVEDLEMFSNVIDYFSNYVKTYQKVFRQGKYVEAKPIAEDYVKKIQQSKKYKVGWFARIRNWYIKTFGDPMTVARMTDGYEDGYFTHCIEELRKGVVNATIKETELRSNLEQFYNQHKKFNQSLTETKVNIRGVEMPLNVAMTYYMTLKREQAWQGLVYSGITFFDGKNDIRVDGIKPDHRLTDAEIKDFITSIAPNLTDEQMSKVLQAVTISDLTFDERKERLKNEGLKVNEANAILDRLINNRYTDEEIREIIEEELAEVESLFTDIQMEYIEICESIFNEECKKLKRETDIRLKGYTNTLDTYYIPISRTNIAKSVDTDFYADMDSVINASFNKNTVKNAKQELFINGLDDVIYKHIRGICQYAYLSDVLREIDIISNLDINNNRNKVLNVNTELKDLFPEGSDYIRELINDVKGISKNNGALNKFSAFIRSGYAKYQLGANPQTWFKQLGAFCSATSILDYKDIVRGMGISGKDVDKYCKLAMVRNTENTNALAQGVLDSKVKKSVNGIQKFGDVLMKPIGLVDRFAMIKLFGACQAYIERNGGAKVGTETNKIEAGKMLERVILETQNNTLATEKSMAMRSGNELAKTLTMFTADGMKVIGRVIDSYGELAALKKRRKATNDPKEIQNIDKRIKEAKKKVKKSTGSLISSAVLMTLITQGFRWLLAKDDEEENILANMGFDVIGNMIGGLPLIKEAYAYVNSGYDIDSYNFQALNDMLESYSKIQNAIVETAKGTADSKDYVSALKSTIMSCGQVLGIPTRNVYNFIYGITKRISPKTSYLIDNTMYNKSYRNDLAKAIEKGDEDMIATLSGLILKEDIGNVDKTTSEEISRLIKAGYDAIPKSSNSFTYEDETYTLSNKEKKAFQKIYGISNEAIKEMTSFKTYEALDDETKAKAIKFIYDTYYNLARDSYLGVDSTSKNVLFAEAIDVEKLAIIVAQARMIEADTDSSGKAISGTKKAKIQRLVNGLKLTVAEKYMVMGYLGYKNVNGESQVKSTIKRLNLTKTEQAALLSYCGY